MNEIKGEKGTGGCGGGGGGGGVWAYGSFLKDFS